MEKEGKIAGPEPGKEAVWSCCWKFWDGCLNLHGSDKWHLPQHEERPFTGWYKKTASARPVIAAEWQNVLEVWWNLWVSYEGLWSATRRHTTTITHACPNVEEMVSILGQCGVFSTVDIEINKDEYHWPATNWFQSTRLQHNSNEYQCVNFSFQIQFLCLNLKMKWRLKSIHCQKKTQQR